jgi:hypothetical protein
MGVNEFIDEITILAYRKLYDELAVPNHKRMAVIRELDGLIARYQPFIEAMQKDREISFISFGQFKALSDKFVKSGFTPAFYKRFTTVPAEPPVQPMMIYNMAVTFVFVLAQVYLESTKKHRKNTIKEHIHKYTTLCEARSCLADYGLHPAIAKRTRLTFCRYNVLIELKQKNAKEEYELLIGEEALNQNYLEPYAMRKSIMVDGKNIDFKNIDRITVSSTCLFDEEIKLFRVRYNKPDDIDFIRACTIETNTLVRKALASFDKKDAEFAAKPSAVKKPLKELAFVSHLIDGIHHLQSLDNRVSFIAELKAGKTGCESEFRDWMETWLKAHFKNAEPEALKGTGRIDLKVTHPKIGNAIVEFKGWWNHNKTMVVQQIYKYLTDFEKRGYLFMINHTAEDIDPAYRNYITKEGTKYITGSWKKINYGNTDFTYFSSRHKIGAKTKTLYHFIYHVHP